jgi:23S rRNA pseudouridine1911/1915/1917 synthase
MHPDSIHVETRVPIRIDVFLVRRLSGVSRARVQRHIAAGNVLVDGARVRSSHRLLGGEVITLPPLTSRRLSEVAETVDIPVVYEDDDLIVVNKPAGLVVHPVGGEFRRTVIGALHRRAAARGEDADALGIVHRLDRLTSGLMVLSKRYAARRMLAEAVEARMVQRSYIAIAQGVPVSSRGCIDHFIRRDPARPTRMQALDAVAAAEILRQGWVPHVSSSGYSDPRRNLRPRRARTLWCVLRRLRGATVLRCRLETGRTHQIRVHLQAIGLPLLGDPLYGVPSAVERPALHAAVLGFAHPSTGAPLRFHAPLPDDLRDLIALHNVVDAARFEPR